MLSKGVKMEAAEAALSALSFNARVSQLIGEVEYRKISTSEDREAVYRLRYEGYLRERMIEPSAAEALSDAFDETPNASLFGIYIRGQLASSLRIHVLSSEHPLSMAFSVFGDLLEPELAKGLTIVDPNRFVTHRDCAQAFPELPLVTVRLAYMASEFFNADLGIAAVRPEHQAFYRRYLMLRTACPPRSFPTLRKTVSLMMVQFPSVRERIKSRYPFFRSTEGERRELFKPSRGPKLAARPTPAQFLDAAAS